MDKTMLPPPPPPGFTSVTGPAGAPEPPPGFSPVQPVAAAAPPPPPGFGPVQTVAAPAAPAADEDWLDRYLLNPLGRGKNNVIDQGLNVLGLELGILTPEDFAGAVLKDRADAAQYPMNPTDQASLDAIMNARDQEKIVLPATGMSADDTPIVAGDVARMTSEIIKNPGAAVVVSAESAPTMVGSLAGGFGGGAAGASLGPAGAAAGAAIGAGTASFANEYLNSILQVLDDRGVTKDKATLAAAVQDPEIMKAARVYALQRGIPVGIFDALSAGVAGRATKVVERFAGEGLAGKLAGAGAEAAAQGAAGASGEASAQLASKGQISDPGSVFLEGVSELPSAALEVPGLVRARGGANVEAQAAPEPPTGFSPVPTEAPPAPPPGFALPSEPVSAAPPSAPGGQPAAPVSPSAAVQPAPTPAPAGPKVPGSLREAARMLQTGETYDVSTPEGSMSVPVTYQVVDASTLAPASGDLQPRDRSRAASDAQIARISGNLDAAKVAHDYFSDRGAPIVDENGIVLSGNGRFAGIMQAADQNPEAYARYVESLRAAGMPVEGLQRPVLVRRVQGLTDQQKTAFAIKSNAASSMGLSPSEQARIDASVIDDGMLSKLDTETEKGVASASNTEFVRSFLGKVEENRHSNYVDSQGRLLPAGVDAIHAALFSKAYSDEQLTQRLVEEEQGSPGLRSTLLGSAPAWAQMRSHAPKALDITDKLVAAVQAIGEMRRAGQKPDTWLAQTDAFQQPDPVTVSLIKAFYNENGTRAAAWRDTRDFLKSYAQKAMDQSKAAGDLTGRTVTPQDIINEVKAEQEKQSAGLFADTAGNDMTAPAAAEARTNDQTNDTGRAAAGPDTAAPGRADAGMDRLQERAGDAGPDRRGGRAGGPDGADDIQSADSEADTPDEVAATPEALLAYHGTFADFAKFDPTFLGSETGAGSAKEGFFFTSNAKVAEGYANHDGYQDHFIAKLMPAKMLELYARFNEALIRQLRGLGLHGIKSGYSTGSILVTRIHFNNPKIVDRTGLELNDREQTALIRQAKAEGHDGVVLKNSIDPGYTDASEQASDIYVVFDPSNIEILSKHATAAEAEDVQERLADGAGVAPLAARTPGGTMTPTFRDFAMSKGAPVSDAALALINIDEATAQNMAPRDKASALARVLSTFFGFMGIDGSRANALQAVDQLQDAYVNLQMMANVIGLPVKAMSLGGRLRLNLEKFTKRTSYLGLYDPNKNAIHLPGRTNSFAHEWMHALDHWLTQRLMPQARGLLSMEARKNGLDPASAEHVAFAHLLNTLFADQSQLAAEVLSLQAKASETNIKGDPTPAALKAQARLDEIVKGTADFAGSYSDYAKNVGLFTNAYGDAKYWLNPAEMLARAGEAYVASKMENAGIEKTNFVSKPDAAYLSSADDRLALTFPKAQDRLAIFAAFDTLFSHLQDNTAFGTGPVASQPAVTNAVPDPAQYATIAAANAAGRQSLVREVKGEVNAAVGNIKRILSGDAAEVGREFRDAAASRAGDQTSGSSVKPRLSTRQRAGNMFRAMLGSMEGRARVAWRRQASPGARAALRAISDMMFSESGTGRTIRETFGDAVRGKTRALFSQLANILHHHGVPEEVAPNAKSAKGIAATEQRKRIRRLLTVQEGEDPASVARAIGATQEDVAVSAALRKFLDKVYRDTVESGVDMGYVENAGYLTRILNEDLVLDDPLGFIDKARQVYEVSFDNGFDADAHAMIEEARKYIAGVDRQRLGPLRRLLKAYTKARKAFLSSDPNTDPNHAQVAQDFQDAQQALADDLKPVWAQLNAEMWKERVAIGDGLHYSDPIGPNASPMRSRSLPPEADKILTDYYISDPIEAAGHYINSVTRKAEFARRFGNPAGEKDFRNLVQYDKSLQMAMRNAGLSVNDPEHRVRAIVELTDAKTTNRAEMLMREADRNGAIPEDVRGMADIVKFITGRPTDNMPGAAHSLATAMSVYGQLALMGRTAWSSVSEPITVLARTRDVHAAVETLAAYVAAIARTQSTQDLKALAQHIGVITTSIQEAAIRNMNEGITNMPVSSSKLLSKFYDRTLLSALTNAQRMSTIKGYHLWLSRIADKAVNGSGVEASKAKADLRELGFKDEEIAPLHDWINQHPGQLPSIAETEDAIGQLWAAGARRFANEVIQEGQKELKPQGATSNVFGRLTFGLTSFLYSFQRNIHQRVYNMALRDYNLRIEQGQTKLEAGGKSAAEFAFRAAVVFGSLYAGQLATTILREFIFNNEQWKRHEQDGDLGKWLAQLAFSRTGTFGALDPVFQAAASIKYQRDLTALTAGPYTSIPLDLMKSIGQVVMTNSPNTNTAEYNLTKNAYRALIAPVISGALSAIPGGKLVGAAAGAGIMWGTSNQAADQFSKAINGRSDAAVRKEKAQHRKQHKDLGAL